MDIHNSKFRLTGDNNNFLLEIYHHNLATQVNRVQNYYLTDTKQPYRFKEGEEAKFMLSQIELNALLRQISAFKSIFSVDPIPYPTPAVFLRDLNK
jgi:hypothetical protein